MSPNFLFGSEQMQEVEPKVSTASKFLTKTCFSAIFLAVMAREIVIEGEQPLGDVGDQDADAEDDALEGAVLDDQKGQQEEDHAQRNSDDCAQNYIILIICICIMGFMFTFGMTLGSSVWGQAAIEAALAQLGFANEQVSYY